MAALVLVVTCLGLAGGTTRGAVAASAPSWRPFDLPVAESSFSVYDASRWTPARTPAPAHPGRTIKAHVYAPVGLSGPLPTVLFAPGYNVGPEFDRLMLNSMASAGYLVIGLDFPGSTWADATGSPTSRDVVNNAVDISFMLTQLQQMPEWSSRIDFSAVAAAGHSDGAIEVAALALNSDHLDRRFAAFIELSGGVDPSFGGTWGPYNQAPLLTSIGTNDEFGARPSTIATWQRAAWPKTLVDVAGGDHWQMYTLWSPQGDAVRGAIVEWMNTALRHDPSALGRFWWNASRLGVSADTASANAIDSTYNLLGTWRSPLGGQTTAVGPDARGYGRTARYQGGAIYDTPGLGTNVVWGEVWNEYRRVGAESGFLGYARTSETVAPDGVGRFNHFQGGSIYWTPATGAHEVHGAIRDRWAATGWERGPLGYPTTDETATPDGTGRFNHFQRGSVYWTAATGAHAVVGPARDLWSAMGWERSWLGYPTEEAVWDGPALRAPFQGGWIYVTGSGAFALTNPIVDRYVLAGGPGGPLGVPTGSTVTSGPVQTSTFAGGTITADTAAGTVTVTTPSGSTTGPVASVGAWADRTYKAVLDRPLDAGGAAWVTSQVRAGAGLLGIAVNVALSGEARSRTVTMLYQQVLHRAPDPGGRAWATAYLAGGGRPTGLVTVLSGSPEFWAAAGRTPAGFVDLAYRRLLGRPADPEGLAYWGGQVARGLALTTVAGALAGSGEAARLAVGGVYRSVLGHEPDPGGLAYWSRWWQGTGGDTVGLIARFTASLEFTNR